MKMNKCCLSMGQMMGAVSRYQMYALLSFTRRHKHSFGGWFFFSSCSLHLFLQRRKLLEVWQLKDRSRQRLPSLHPEGFYGLCGSPWPKTRRGHRGGTKGRTCRSFRPRPRWAQGARWRHKPWGRANVQAWHHGGRGGQRGERGGDGGRQWNKSHDPGHGDRPSGAHLVHPHPHIRHPQDSAEQRDTEGLGALQTLASELGLGHRTSTNRPGIYDLSDWSHEVSWKKLHRNNSSRRWGWASVLGPNFEWALVARVN